MEHSKNMQDLEQRVLELEQDKSQLLKLVSHDVKSPFNKLFALSNLLQLTSDNLNDEQLDYLTRMDWVIKEGLTVVRNLLDLRAIENNAIDLQVEEVKIDTLVSEVLRSYSKQIGTKYLILNQILDNVTNWSNKRALERIIDNLISNGVKFTPKEGTLNINLSKEGTFIKLEISSTSGPIQENETNKLFMKGSPLSTRPTHGESALGNGLFIAKSYAASLGGSIEFSQHSDTVSFKLSLPEKEANS